MSPIPSIYAHLVRVAAHSLSRARTHRVHTPGDTIVSPREYRPRTFVSVLRCASTAHLRELCVRGFFPVGIRATNTNDVVYFFTTPVFLFRSPPSSTVFPLSQLLAMLLLSTVRQRVGNRVNDRIHARTRNTILSRRRLSHHYSRFSFFSLSPFFCRFWFATRTTVSTCHSAEDQSRLTSRREHRENDRENEYELYDDHRHNDDDNVDEDEDDDNDNDNQDDDDDDESENDEDEDEKSNEDKDASLQQQYKYHLVFGNFERIKIVALP